MIRHDTAAPSTDDDDDGSSFGQLLRAARQAAGFEVLDLSRIVGLSASYLYEVERGGRSALSAQHVRLICDALRADPLPLLRASIRERRSVLLEISDLSQGSPEVDLAAHLAATWPPSGEDLAE